MIAKGICFEVAGNGPPLYMVHGIGSRKTTWNPLVAELATHFTCVSYDLRGHGGSDVLPTPYLLDDLVNDLEMLRSHLGHEQIRIMGHSLGGMIGPAYARAYSDKVDSLVLLSTAAGRSKEDRNKLKNLTDSMNEKGVMPVIDTLVHRWFTDGFIANRPDAIEHRKRQIEETPENVFLSVVQIYAQTEMAPWLKEIKCPCLIMTGELDGGCHVNLNRFMHGELENSKLVILDGLKHSILVEAPDRVLKHVKEFLFNE